MARFLLAASAAALMLAGVDAAAVVRTTRYSGDLNTCAAADAQPEPSDVTTNVCAGRTKWFCNDQYTYRVAYADDDCTATRISSVTQLANTCGFFQRNQQMTCVNATQGPALPTGTTWPPAGFRVNTLYWNTTEANAKSADVCAPGVNISVVQSASNNLCLDRVGYDTGSFNGACAADGSMIGSVTYANVDCTGAILNVVLQPAGQCRDGTISTCGSLPTLPAAIPTSGYTMYKAGDTTCSGEVDSITLRGTTCDGNKKLQCLVQSNGTYVDDYTFGASNTGSCPGVPINEEIYRVDECVLSGEASKKYTCTFTPPQPAPAGGSASTLSVSLAAVLAVAVAALFSL